MLAPTLQNSIWKGMSFQWLFVVFLGFWAQNVKTQGTVIEGWCLFRVFWNKFWRWGGYLCCSRHYFIHQFWSFNVFLTNLQVKVPFLNYLILNAHYDWFEDNKKKRWNYIIAKTMSSKPQWKHKKRITKYLVKLHIIFKIRFHTNLGPIVCCFLMLLFFFFHSVRWIRMPGL